MSDTFDLVVMAALPGHRAGPEGLRRAGAARQGQEGQERGRDPRRARRERRGPRRADRRPPRPQGHGLGRRRGRPRRPGRAAAARRDRRRRGRRRHRRQVRQAQGRQRPRGGPGREAQARHRRDHRDHRRGAPARGRARARRLAGQVRRADGQARPPRPEGRARRGGRQVRARPHGAADPGQDLRRHRRPDAQGLGRRLVVHPRTQGAGGRTQRARSSSSTTPASAPSTPSAAAQHARPSPACRTWGSRTTGSTSPPSARRRARRCSPAATTTASASAPSPSSPARSPATRPASPRSCAAFPRILKENGYVTGGFGKWHLTPDNVQGAAGPFDHWPKSWGFDHWWGFLSGAAGQYDPIITQDNWTLGVPEGKDGKLYYFPDDITDKSVEWLHAVRAQDAQKPWMVFYSTGCAHAPHHVAPEWADKYKGQFDDGWDALPRATLERAEEARHRAAGHRAHRASRRSSPPGTRSPTTQKKLYARQMEVYCRLPGERRLERRPPAGLRRGDGRSRQHARHLHLGRQRRQPGGHDHRLVQRDDVPQRRRARRRAAARAHRPVRRHRGARRRPHGAAHRRRLGARLQRARSSGASSRPATSAAPATRWSWRGRAASRPDKEMRSQFTHCIDVGPTILEAGRHPRAQGRRRHRAGAHGRHELPVHAGRRRRRPSSTPSSTSRCSAAAPCTRTAGGRRREPDRLPWDFSPQTLAQFGAGRDWDPDRDVGWELYDLTDGLLAGARRRRRASREGRRAPGALVAGGGAQPRAAAHGRHVA